MPRLLLICALLLSVSVRATGLTPGTYTHYAFDGAQAGFESVDFAITVDQDPGYTANVYWSNQFDLVGSSGAYAGMQSNGGDKRMFLFSAWDANEARAGSEGSYCVRFDGEGEGYSCRKQHDWKQDHTYRFRATIGADQWLTVAVDDLTEGTSFTLGSIKTGSRRISAENMTNWTEYFEWNDERATCSGQPYSKATFALPKGSVGGRKFVAKIESTRDSDACEELAEVHTTADGTVHENGLGSSQRGVLKIGSLCLDALEGLQEGSQVGLYPCGGANQYFVHTHQGAIETMSSYCLSDDAGQVKLRSCEGPGAPTRWQFNAGEVRKQGTMLCLTHATDRHAVTLLTCGGSAAQQWDLSSLGRDAVH
ncbi:MAG TPA: ricin-type beta-trefoil lectin domain protein [Stenotrophomonas sp.]|nr:ricin-type beta-trefoil lectin domain protein [Stenotrophomonas sp.]